MSSVGDLGRRVTERREELGLSSEAVAARAGMDPDYVRSLETSPSPQVSRGALLRLADALETTVGDVSGQGTQEPPGRGDRPGQGALDALDDDECRALIGPGGVGRVVFSEPRGPVALPVNFRMLEGDVVFRTAPSAALVSALEQGGVSFEVDRLDDALTEGWSVLVSGNGRLITDQGECQRAVALGIVPWAGGERDAYIRIVARQVTGRRIRNR